MTDSGRTDSNKWYQSQYSLSGHQESDSRSRMDAPLNLEEGQSSTRPPHFNGHFYSWWKVRMHDFLMDEGNELWDMF